MPEDAYFIDYNSEINVLIGTLAFNGCEIIYLSRMNDAILHKTFTYSLNKMNYHSPGSYKMDERLVYLERTHSGVLRGDLIVFVVFNIQNSMFKNRIFNLNFSRRCNAQENVSLENSNF